MVTQYQETSADITVMICPGKPTVVAKALGSNNPLHWVKVTTVKPILSKINMLDYQTWHNQMGHASATIIIIKQMKIDKLLIPKEPIICPGCTQGKMHNKPHLISEK